MDWILRHKKTRQFFALLLYFAAFLLALSLLSYYHNDPSYIYASSNKPMTIHNICGSIGAHCSALLFYFFGFGAYVLVFLLIFLAHLFWTGACFAQQVERIGAGITLMFTVSVLSATYSFDGGRIGYVLSPITHSLFHGAGRAIPFIILFASLILLLRFSGITLIHVWYQYVARITGSSNVLVGMMILTKRSILYVYNCIYVLYNTLRSLFNGSVLEQSQTSIMSFEYDIDDEITTDLEKMSDQYRKDYREIKITPSKQKQSTVKTERTSAGAEYRLPGRTLFSTAIPAKSNQERQVKEREQSATLLQEKLKRFGINGHVVAIKPGPVVTLFEYQPNIDTKLSRIVALEDDLALALQALSVRIIAPIPGTAVVGFEVANKQRETVSIADIMQSAGYRSSTSMLPLILGIDTAGTEVIVDLALMPHLLVAGSTGSGKSVSLNTMLISLLCKRTPDELRLVLIDPKRIEFGSYADIAHLAFPVITAPKQAIAALKWVVNEMERRYELLARAGMRTIADYHAHVQKEGMPFLVVVIDELSDLMMTAGREVEDLITRITQMARAAGIHMIVATQRPSVDVITGLIKVNFPSRISFRVTSKIDSRTILDVSGAEKLLGAGDMLFLNARNAVIQRIHGAYVSDQEIQQVVQHIQHQRKTVYFDVVLEQQSVMSESAEDEELMQQVLEFINTIDEISISLLQRRFKIGYNRSARIIDLLQARGVITPPEAGRVRKVIR